MSGFSRTVTGPPTGGHDDRRIRDLPRGPSRSSACRNFPTIVLIFSSQPPTARVTRRSRATSQRAPGRPASCAPDEVLRAQDLGQPSLVVDDRPADDSGRDLAQDRRRWLTGARPASATNRDAMVWLGPERHAMIARERIGEFRHGDPPEPRASAIRSRSNVALAIAAATSVTARVASSNIDATSGCRSSSVSTMSPNGVLWTASRIARPVRAPCSRARARARARPGCASAA